MPKINVTFMKLLLIITVNVASKGLSTKTSNDIPPPQALKLKLINCHSGLHNLIQESPVHEIKKILYPILKKHPVYTGQLVILNEYQSDFTLTEEHSLDSKNIQKHILQFMLKKYRELTLSNISNKQIQHILKLFIDKEPPSKNPFYYIPADEWKILNNYSSPQSHKKIFIKNFCSIKDSLCNDTKINNDDHWAYWVDHHMPKKHKYLWDRFNTYYESPPTSHLSCDP